VTVFVAPLPANGLAHGSQSGNGGFEDFCTRQSGFPPHHSASATIVGNVITVFCNATQIMQATDSACATGNSGLGVCAAEEI
jgi:hypothetical protein